MNGPLTGRAKADPASRLEGTMGAVRTVVLAAAAGAVAAVPFAAPAAAAPAAAAAAAGAAPAGVGYVRLAHLSPDTPPVDVYLTAFSRPQWRLVLRGVGYGQVSPYERLQPDLYTVAMRPAGAPAGSPAVLSATVHAGSGSAFTVAGLGRRAELGLKVIADDLRLPRAGQARIRVIQAAASLGAVNVAVDRGPAVISDAGFAAVSRYVDAPAGRHRLTVTSSDGSRPPATLNTEFAANDVYSLLVLDQAGTVALRTQVDASGPGSVPAGPVETGAGGTAPHPTSPLAPLLVSGLVLAAAAALARPRHGGAGRPWHSAAGRLRRAAADRL